MVVEYQPPGTPVHGPSRHSDRTRQWFIPARCFKSALGAPVDTSVGSWSTVFAAWRLREAQDDGLMCEPTPLPEDWASGAVTISLIGVAAGAGGTGNMRFDVAAKTITLSSGDPAGSNTINPGQTFAVNGTLQKLTFSTTLSVSAGQFIRLVLDRNGTNSGQDTSTDDFYFIGALLEYTADD